VSAHPEVTLLAGVRVAWQTLPPARARREIADALVARIATASTGGTVIVGRRCERCGATDHGRPVVTGAPIQASVSYTADVVVVAVADACRVLALGIDAERGAPTRQNGLRGLIIPGQRTSLRHWTRVEAVLKADGRGLSVDPRRVRIERTLGGVHGSITGESARTERGVRPASAALGIRPRLLRVRGPRGIVISLAVASV
jgi:4'-phosphopantetheinyl transferase